MKYEVQEATSERPQAVEQSKPQPKAEAVRRVLKRRDFRAQKELLRTGKGPALGPGEEMELAKAGFLSPARDLPYRAEIERRFGQPLAHVKAHVGPEASESASLMGAEAYTLGSHIAFASPTPAPETVAHEVTHVLQQTRAEGPGAQQEDLEKEADNNASKVPGQAPTLTPGKVRVQKKEKLPKGKEAFEKMWAAHPHNYQEDPSENTSSAALLEEVGLPTSWNTCAIRLSRMLNKIGLRITPAKVKAAGISRPPYYSKKTKEYLILSAKEMWTYLQKNFRKADAIFPGPNKTYKDSEEFQKAFEEQIKPVVKVRKGIVAFEKIFGYSGTGHMDLFDGLKLSDAPDWYPSMRLHLWYVVVPEEAGL